jgi:N6-L-threonylcarbamoyladenine synthase
VSLVLSIETSCDDTSVALVKSDGFVVDLLNANQDLTHLPFGGVVPELASRNHTLTLLPLINQILVKNNFKHSDLAGICVTNRPGLVGSLLVGLVTAKTLALSWSLPFLGVNHLEGHLMAPWLKDTQYSPKQDLNKSFPCLVLAVSGGHTHLCKVAGFGDYTVLGQSVDDAAGEALDKFAKELGLGFPGGALLDKWARSGDPKSYTFPQGLKNQGLNFSFSGTKAAGLRLLESLSETEITKNINNLCASFEYAVVESLFEKLSHAFSENKYKCVAITGGVSANTYLRQKALEFENQKQTPVLIPPLKYCTDNAAMIGYAGVIRLLKGQMDSQALAPSSSSYEKDFKYV